MADPPPDPKPPQVPNVPDHLMQKLHEANTRFAEARKNLEGAMDGTDYPHQERVNQKEDELKKVEKDLEDLNKQIDGAMKKKI